jgi:hypothetical protein
VGATGEPVNHFGPAHFLGAPPGIQIPITLEREAVLLDAHVAHFHLSNELVDGHASGPLERVKDFQPLGTANFCD